MTVRLITADQKKDLVGYYTMKAANQKELATIYKISERSVNRVLNEAGVATAIPRLKGEAYQAMKLLAENNMTISDLKALILSSAKPSKEVIQDYLTYCDIKIFQKILEEVGNARYRAARQRSVNAFAA